MSNVENVPYVVAFMALITLSFQILTGARKIITNALYVQKGH